MKFKLVFFMKMKFYLVFSILCNACGVEPASQTAIADVQGEAVTRDKQEATPQERPKMKVTTPVVLFLTSAAVAGCFAWLLKHCGGKLYRRIVRPHWGADDWGKYQDFIRTELDNLFNARNHSNRRWSDYSKHADDIGSNTSSGYSKHADDIGSNTSSGYTQIRKDPYEVLGLGRNATADEIKHKYRTLAKQYHPDKNHGDEAAAATEEKFREIADAYQQLKDQGKVR